MARVAITLDADGSVSHSEGGVAAANETTRFAILNRTGTTLRLNASAPAGVTYQGDSSAVVDAGAWAEFAAVNSTAAAHSVTIAIATTHGTSAHDGEIALLYY